MEQGTPYKGPEILWRAGDIKRMVDFLGRENAILFIAEGVFLKEYVERRVDEMLGLKETEIVTDRVIENSEAAGA